VTGNIGGHSVGLAGCFPDRAAAGSAATTAIEDGWDSRVLLVAGDTVVRVPRRPEVEGVLRVEGRLLRELAPVLPVAVPTPHRICDQHGSMAYPHLPGTPLDDDTMDRVGAGRPIAAQVASVLAATWSFPAGRARELGVAPHSFAPALDHFRRRVLPLVDDVRGARLLDHAGRQLRDVAEVRLVHGDLGPAHVLCDDGGVVGVIDWSDSHLGDPAIDLAWALHGLGGRLRAPLLEHLDVDRATVERAGLIHRLGPWWEVVHGLDHDRPDLVRSGLAGIAARL
jgi:aminoglycoside phosphotransferase (APT) family kinase protein